MTSQHGRAAQMVSRRVGRFTLQDKGNFFVGLLVVLGCKVETPNFNMGIHALRIQVDRLPERGKGSAPLLERQFGLGQLIVSLRETWIELDGVAELDRGFLVLARFQITLSALEVFHLPLLGVK